MPNEVRKMHYDFKQKLNKLDSQQYRNLKVPEIDWKLNEALYLFVKSVAQPRTNNGTGVEVNTRTINDIRTLIVPNVELIFSDFKEGVVKAALPDNYLFHLVSSSVCSKGTCEAEIKHIVQKHGFQFDDYYTKSSFGWRDVNVLFVGDDLHIYTEQDFTISKVLMDYIKKPVYFHTAVDAAGGKYYLPDGETLLEGYLNCELPEPVHSEIVDLAVLITVGDLSSDYQSKYSKIQLIN